MKRYQLEEVNFGVINDKDSNEEIGKALRLTYTFDVKNKKAMKVYNKMCKKISKLNLKEVE